MRGRGGGQDLTGDAPEWPGASGGLLTKPTKPEAGLTRPSGRPVIRRLGLRAMLPWAGHRASAGDSGRQLRSPPVGRRSPLPRTLRVFYLL